MQLTTPRNALSKTPLLQHGNIICDDTRTMPPKLPALNKQPWWAAGTRQQPTQRPLVGDFHVLV